jgi:uncharacterized protein DUF1236
MNSFLRGPFIAAVLLVIIGVVPVQAQGTQDGTVGMRSDSTGSEPAQKPRLSAAQKETIFTAIRRSRMRVTPPPRDLSVGIGVTIPSGTELFALPEGALKQVPDAEPYKFTIINNTLILVDPTTMQVVATVRQ